MGQRVCTSLRGGESPLRSYVACEDVANPKPGADMTGVARDLPRGHDLL